MVKFRVLVLAAVLLPGVMRSQAGADQYKAGRALMDSNKADAALKAFEKAVALDDKNAEYHLWLGNAVGSVARDASVLRQPRLVLHRSTGCDGWQHSESP
jgi:tetratricopeptide (TPR) repeat protein